MGIISNGFLGRRRTDDPRLPPGQYLTEGFPVLSAGPTPRIAKDDWAFTITTEKGDVHRWSWDEFLALPQEDVGTDIHCVTSWSKLGTSWRGVALDTLFKDVDTSFEYTMAHSYGGYTTNVPLGCWCRTCTSGRAPSGSTGCRCCPRTSPASGSRTATTCTATRGRNSATGEQCMASGRRGRYAHGDPHGPHHP